MTQSIPGPIASIEPVRHAPPPGACDCHAHIFGPADRFPYAEGRGYTPPDAPVDAYLALLDGLGLARGVVVQGNAHGYDNRVIHWLAGWEPQLCEVVAAIIERAGAHRSNVVE